jgi:hypothetical protein
VVPDLYCQGGDPYDGYFRYYGGRSSGGYVSRGGSVRPKGSPSTASATPST